MKKEKMTLANQRTTISRLVDVLIMYGYDEDKISVSCMDCNCFGKKFYPDIIARMPKKSVVYEVEYHSTNNTIFKSITSVMKFIRENSVNGTSVQGYLVVRKGSVEFARECLHVMKDNVAYFSSGRVKNNLFDKIDIVSFNEVAHFYQKVSNRGRGGLPSCDFLP